MTHLMRLGVEASHRVNDNGAVYVMDPFAKRIQPVQVIGRILPEETGKRGPTLAISLRGRAATTIRDCAERIETLGDTHTATALLEIGMELSHYVGEDDMVRIVDPLTGRLKTIPAFQTRQSQSGTPAPDQPAP